MSAGKRCLKCDYVRTDRETAPSYECPKCGAIYAKVEAVSSGEAPPRSWRPEPRVAIPEQQSASTWPNNRLSWLLYTIAALSLMGGFIGGYKLWPESAEAGYTWKPIVYLPAWSFMAAGLINFALFAGFGKALELLTAIERKTTSANKSAA